METDPATDSTATPPATPPPPDGFLSKLFLKDDGLRAGWRLLLYGLFLESLKFSTLLLLSELVPPERGVLPLGYEFVLELASFLVAFAAAMIMAQIEKRPVGVYGLPVRSAFRGLFWQGYFFGLSEISVVVSLMAIFGGYSFGSLALHGADIVRWGLAWAVGFLVVGFSEEFLFRGYTQYTLGEGIGFWPAAAILSVTFGLLHRSNPGENSFGVAGVMLAGLFWSFTLRRTGNLWFAVGMHAGFDFGETFLYSVPNSGLVMPGHLSNAVLHGPAWLTGGTPGPEASVFDFAILIVFFFIFNAIYPATVARKT
jgi:CAAX protease family protein